MTPMIPIEMIIRKNPQLWVGISLICLFVFVPIVVWISDREWFRRGAIEVKYCYHWDGDTIQSFCRYNKGNRINCFEKAYWMLAYYYTPDSLFPDIYRPVIENSDFGQLRSINKVEVLCYSEDSLLAKIRYNYPTSGSFTETVGVHEGYQAEETEVVVDYTHKSSCYPQQVVPNCPCCRQKIFLNCCPTRKIPIFAP